MIRKKNVITGIVVFVACSILNIFEGDIINFKMFFDNALLGVITALGAEIIVDIKVKKGCK